MKKLALLFVPFLFLFGGCKKLDKLTQFEMEFKEQVTIPSSTGVNFPIDLTTPDVESNSESSFANNKTSKNLIDEIKLSALELTLSSPSNGDFGFLKSIEIYINAEGQDETKIAWKENIPADIDDYLSLETSNEDLKAFIKADNFSLRIKTVTDEILTSDHTIDIKSTFFVDATILGFD